MNSPKPKPEIETLFQLDLGVTKKGGAILIWVFPKIMVPQMDGENNGKPY